MEGMTPSEGLLWLERGKEASGIGLEESHDPQPRDRQGPVGFTAAFSKLPLVQTQLGSQVSTQALPSLLLPRKSGSVVLPFSAQRGSKACADLLS